MFNGENYRKYKSHFAYQESKDIVTTPDEIEQLKKLQAEGKTIMVRLRLTGGYVDNRDEVLETNYMYKVV